MTTHAVDPARRAAYETVRAVADRDAYANLVLPGLLRQRSIGGRDAAFATELAYGALRGLGTYDAVIASASKRPATDIDPAVRDVLRLGAHQLLRMRVPAHAAVSSAVDLASRVAGRKVTGFANAVLRRVAAQTYEEWMAELAPAFDEDPIGHLALVHMHPRWIVEVFRTALGGDIDETARACAADNVAAPVHLAARPGLIDRDRLVASVGPTATAGPWSPYAVHLSGGDPAAIDAVRTGTAIVQDEGSQLAALALANAELPVPAPERRWLDMCAGPGGKAALLAGLAGERGIDLVAADRSVHRAQLVMQTLTPAARTLVLAVDGTRPAWPAATFDRVLVDAPCTGLGALRRRPEARWRRRADDARRLQPTQVALLESAVDAVRPGGVVAYVTCSPDVRETADVVRAVLASRDVEPVAIDVPPALVDTQPDASTGSVQVWPHRHNTDAMFVAVLRRRPGI